MKKMISLFLLFSTSVLAENQTGFAGCWEGNGRGGLTDSPKYDGFFLRVDRTDSENGVTAVLYNDGQVTELSGSTKRPTPPWSLTCNLYLRPTNPNRENSVYLVEVSKFFDGTPEDCETQSFDIDEPTSTGDTYRSIAIYDSSVNPPLHYFGDFRPSAECPRM
jgi:hypothetical protein